MPPAGADDCSRDAVFTTSPVTASPIWGPAPGATTASPVLIPWRTASDRAGSSRFSSSIADWIDRAARTARSGSSSCATGEPNTPNAASPMNLSSVPPNASISRFSRAWNGRRVAFTSSGSAWSERAVNPTRSQNRTVTILRSSIGCAPVASGAPQNPQNRKPSGFSPPQDGHVIAFEV